MTATARPHQVGDLVQSVATGVVYRVTYRWRDPGMRSYDYEGERVDSPGVVNTFHKHQIVAAPRQP